MLWLVSEELCEPIAQLCLVPDTSNIKNTGVLLLLGKLCGLSEEISLPLFSPYFLFPSFLLSPPPASTLLFSFLNFFLPFFPHLGCITTG